MNHPLHHKTTAAKSRRDGQANGGFALVIALSLMAFVLLLLLSITTLTQVEIRTAGMQKEKLQAQQNALLGLSTAIGQLQKLAGPDTRITAPAESIATVNGPRQVTGVWRSWEGRDHDSSGTTIGLAHAPDYASKLVNGELAPDSSAAGRFLGWLSSDALNNQDPTDPPTLTETLNTIPLLSSQTLGDDRESEEVHIMPTEIAGSARTSAYAWWINGENTKASLKYEETPTTSFDWASRLATFGTVDATVFNLESDAELNRISSSRMLDLLPTVTPPTAGEARLSGLYYHDLTAWSRGLLTNAATGGWKRDLSLMAEDWNRLPTTNLGFFTLTPGVETSAYKADGPTTLAQTLIYPWGIPKGTDNISATWNTLQDYATQYRNITTSSSNGRVAMPSFAGIRNGPGASLNDWRDKVRRYPVVARMHWVFSYSAIPNPSTTGAADKYIACIVMNPVFTLWNPYNVELTDIDSLTVAMDQPFPANFEFTLEGTTYDWINMWQIVGGSRFEIKFENTSGGNVIALQPGETRIYSPKDNNPVIGANSIALRPGYRTNAGFRYELVIVAGKRLTGSKQDRLSVVVSLNASVYGNESSGKDKSKTGIAYTLSNSDGQIAWHRDERRTLDRVSLTNPASGDPKPDKLKLGNLSGFADPFLAGYITRFAATPGSVVRKGLLSASPLNFYSHDFLVRSGIHQDYVVFPLNGTGGSEGIPEESASGEHSHIGAGSQPQTGMTHMITAEIPLRPLRSIGELQHFDITNTNGYRPFVYGAIGNSHAFGTLSPDSVAGGFQNQNYRWLDHSYLSNHLFFDDWFVSSIAPETNAWSATAARNKEKVYEEHLSQTVPLPNAFYLPRTPASEAEANSRASDDLSSDDAWRTIASQLEIDGMFNVNSTSVLAWTALLRNLRDVQMPQFNYNSSSWDIQLDAATDTDTAISRTTVAGSSSTDIGINPNLGAYSRLSTTQIEALATEIVNQIKLRGPFLSLSEFVNRQLVSDNTERALAGTIEAALLKLSDIGGSSYTAANNPNINILDIFTERAQMPTSEFPEADQGSAFYGFPGWVRQADILRSLAPILSVRDDTFRIRSYGDYRDPVSGLITSQAWCEAVVQRKADYVNPANANTALPNVTLLDADNALFGRRFEIVSFRWLSPEEI